MNQLFQFVFYEKENHINSQPNTLGEMRDNMVALTLQHPSLKLHKNILLNQYWKIQRGKGEIIISNPRCKDKKRYKL